MQQIKDVIDNYTKDIQEYPHMYDEWYRACINCLTEEERRVFFVYADFFYDTRKNIDITAKYFDVPRHVIVSTLKSCRIKMKLAIENYKINKEEYYD